MYSLEFKQSRGCITETYYARDVIDMYIIYKDGKRIFSQNGDWADYYLVLNIDNYNKDIRLSKRASCYDIITNDFYQGSYSVRLSDFINIKEELLDYLNEMKQVLGIEDYEIIIIGG